VRSLAAGASATKGRPLGATIHVHGINKTKSASPLFGDFYRCASPEAGGVSLNALRICCAHTSLSFFTAGLHRLPGLHSLEPYQGFFPGAAEAR
jgi:hypothetical protein